MADDPNRADEMDRPTDDEITGRSDDEFEDADEMDDELEDEDEELEER